LKRIFGDYIIKANESEVQMNAKSLFWLFLVLLTACSTPQNQEAKSIEVSDFPTSAEKQIAATHPPEVKAEIVDYNWVKNKYSKQITCIGLLKNTSEIPIFAEIILTARDSSGSLTMRESGITSISILPPGGISPFQIYLLDVEECPNCELSISPQAANWETPYQDFKILSDTASVDKYSGVVKIIGEIENTGKKSATYATISVALFDESGKIIGVGIGFPDANPLPAGAKSTYQVLIAELASDQYSTYRIYPVVASMTE
jgi:hypothetical protein